MSKLCPALSMAFAQLLHPPVEKRTPCDEAPDEGFFASVRGCTLGQSPGPSSCREDLPLSAHRELVTDAERRFTLTSPSTRAPPGEESCT